MKTRWECKKKQKEIEQVYYVGSKKATSTKALPLRFLNQGLWGRAPSLMDIHRGWCRSHFCPIAGWRSQPFLPMFLLQSWEEAREYLRKECLRYNPTEGSCIYAICLKPGGLVIGYRKANSSYDLGYTIQRTYIGIRGLWQKLAELCWSSLKGTVFPISQLHTM